MGDTVLYNMVKVDFTDHEFAKFLNDQDPNWTWDTINEFNRFMCNGTFVALVKYKNDIPLARWIWVDKDLIKGHIILKKQK